MSWSRVRHDFPGLDIVKAPGPVYRIAFRNLETGSGFQRTVGGLLFMGSLLAFFVIIFSLWPRLQDAYGELPSWVNATIVFGSMGAPGVIYYFFMPNYQIPRVIEIDGGRDRLRVLRRNRVEIERSLSKLHNLTVDDHPDGAMAREERMGNREKNPRIEEKQHCLIGWFGTGGAEQVILLYRIEWPNRRSLFAVRQAVLWAKQQATGTPVQEQAAEPKRAGLNPPLD